MAEVITNRYGGLRRDGRDHLNEVPLGAAPEKLAWSGAGE